MAGFLFKLETADGKPAEPLTARQRCTQLVRVRRSISPTRRCASLASETTTRTSRRYWSLRTRPNKRLAPRTVISSVRSGPGRGKRAFGSPPGRLSVDPLLTTRSSLPRGGLAPSTSDRACGSGHGSRRRRLP